MSAFKIARRGNLQARRSNLFARHSSSTLGSVTPSVTTGAASSFGTFSAGTYTITYTTGAVSPVDYSGIRYYSINKAPTTTYFRVNYNGGGANTPAPGDGLPYGTGADCQAANTGESITITHTGGTITVQYIDPSYGDNVAAGDVGSPTFVLSQ